MVKKVVQFHVIVLYLTEKESALGLVIRKRKFERIFVYYPPTRTTWKFDVEDSVTVLQIKDKISAPTLSSWGARISYYSRLINL